MFLCLCLGELSGRGEGNVCVYVCMVSLLGFLLKTEDVSSLIQKISSALRTNGGVPGDQGQIGRE